MIRHIHNWELVPHNHNWGPVPHNHNWGLVPHNHNWGPVPERNTLAPVLEHSRWPPVPEHSRWELVLEHSRWELVPERSRQEPDHSTWLIRRNRAREAWPTNHPHRIHDFRATNRRILDRDANHLRSYCRSWKASHRRSHHLPIVLRSHRNHHHRLRSHHPFWIAAHRGQSNHRRSLGRRTKPQSPNQQKTSESSIFPPYQTQKCETRSHRGGRRDIRKLGPSHPHSPKSTGDVNFSDREESEEWVSLAVD
jgi:hypothetical protein